jgi:hypothetical protein
MDSDQMSRMLAQIVNGVPKDKTVGVEMTAEASAMWDRIATEVDAAKSKGLQIDVPGEWPNPDDTAPAPTSAAATTPAQAPTAS